MRPKVLSVTKHVYPLSYDKNAKSGYQEWRKYIRTELTKSITPADMMVVEANRVLVRDARYKDDVSFKPNVKIDRIVYMVFLTLAIAVGILTAL